MPQRKLDGGDVFKGVYDTDPTRNQAITEDPTLLAWVKASASCAGKGKACYDKGDMAQAAVWRELARVAANSREQRYLSWLRKTGRL